MCNVLDKNACYNTTARFPKKRKVYHGIAYVCKCGKRTWFVCSEIKRAVRIERNESFSVERR